jgi:hypothetical protein
MSDGGALRSRAWPQSRAPTPDLAQEVSRGTRGITDLNARMGRHHVGFDRLAGYLDVNRRLAGRHGLRCALTRASSPGWTNAETFERDMPIRFLPIKWEKLLLKLHAARVAGHEKAITFEFSHFLSPNSAYPQAAHLYDRNKEHFGL